MADGSSFIKWMTYFAKRPRRIAVVVERKVLGCSANLVKELIFVEVEKIHGYI